MKTLTTISTKDGIFVKDLVAELQLRAPADPRRIVSHEYSIWSRVCSQSVVNLINCFSSLCTKLQTMSTSLVSTSLIFAYAHDLFLTRVTPCGTFDVLSKNLNQLQLVLIAGPGPPAAILIARPSIRQKNMEIRW